MQLKYTDETIEQYYHNPGVIYIVELSSKDEIFIKIGITQFSVKERRPGREGKYTITRSTQIPMGIYKAYFIEQAFIKKHSKSTYFPKRHFGGITECFNFTYQDAVNKLRETIKETHVNQRAD
jgi:hypothetical protein